MLGELSKAPSIDDEWNVASEKTHLQRGKFTSMSQPNIEELFDETNNLVDVS